VTAVGGMPKTETAFCRGGCG